MTTTTRFGIEFNLKPDQIYLDSATIGKIPVSSIKKIQEYYKSGGGAPVRGVHNEISSSNRLLEENRKSLSRIFNIESSQISFFPSRETVLTSVFHSIPNIGEKKLLLVF